MKEFLLRARHGTEFVDITAQVQSAIHELAGKVGVDVVFVPHATDGITINENTDPCVIADIGAVLDNLVPWKGRYQHTEGNAAAHIKTSSILILHWASF